MLTLFQSLNASHSVNMPAYLATFNPINPINPINNTPRYDPIHIKNTNTNSFSIPNKTTAKPSKQDHLQNALPIQKSLANSPLHRNRRKIPPSSRTDKINQLQLQFKHALEECTQKYEQAASPALKNCQIAQCSQYVNDACKVAYPLRKKDCSNHFKPKICDKYRASQPAPFKIKLPHVVLDEDHQGWFQG